MQIADADITPEGSVLGDADTDWSPAIRPDVLVGPEQRRQQQEIAAALFGGPEEAVSYGRYRLLNRLGEGGMGVVYAAYDEHLERKIALKLIRPSSLDSVQARERTLREARVLARLSHRTSCTCTRSASSRAGCADARRRPSSTCVRRCRRARVSRPGAATPKFFLAVAPPRESIVPQL